VQEQRKDQFFYNGDALLTDIRTSLISFSLDRSSKRLKHAREKVPSKGEVERFFNEAESLKELSNVSSEVGNTRPISFCSFSDTGALLATSDWSGCVKVFDVEKSTIVWSNAEAHSERAQHVAWLDEHRLLSCGADNLIKVWGTNVKQEESAESGPISPACELTGHSQRVNRSVPHPNQSLVVSTSYDSTWKLWDLQSGGVCLSTQEGHRGAIYGCAIHPDGSLVATTGLDGITRVWDLRSGNAVITLKGHVKMVLGVDFNANGFHLATGSDDNSIRIWDLRKRATMYNIPAHSNCISSIKYCRDSDWLISSSFDKSVKIWNAKDFSSVAFLSGHSDRVTCCDMHPTKNMVASVSFDKTIKFYM
jgi:U4/U6 small nuclear ribonucleoprotein PRP4